MSEKELNQRFSKNVKLRMVAETFGLKGEELGRYLRRNGISSCELRDWREQMTDSLDEGRPVARSEKKSLNSKIKLLENEVANLQRELNEARLLLDIQKKVQVILEDEKEENTVKKHVKPSSK
ncbi:MAG: transposase [Bdellovibrio sp.]